MSVNVEQYPEIAETRVQVPWELVPVRLGAVTVKSAYSGGGDCVALHGPIQDEDGWRWVSIMDTKEYSAHDGSGYSPEAYERGFDGYAEVGRLPAAVLEARYWGGSTGFGTESTYAVRLATVLLGGLVVHFTSGELHAFGQGMRQGNFDDLVFLAGRGDQSAPDWVDITMSGDKLRELAQYPEYGPWPYTEAVVLNAQAA